MSGRWAGQAPALSPTPAQVRPTFAHAALPHNAPAAQPACIAACAQVLDTIAELEKEAGGSGSEEEDSSEGEEQLLDWRAKKSAF